MNSKPQAARRAPLARLAALGSIAGAAALLAVSSVEAQIDDLVALFGGMPPPSGYQRLAATAAADCGELGAERESCEIAVMRLAPPDGTAGSAGL